MSISIVVRQEDAAVLIDASLGEYLTYKIAARGAQPIFALVDLDSQAVLMSHKDSPSQQGVYTRKWPKPVDPVTVNTNHTLGLHFLAAIKYTYTVEHCDADGALIRLLIDIDYESQNPEATYFQNLGVVTV